MRLIQPLPLDPLIATSGTGTSKPGCLMMALRIGFEDMILRILPGTNMKDVSSHKSFRSTSSDTTMKYAARLSHAKRQATKS